MSTATVEDVSVAAAAEELLRQRRHIFCAVCMQRFRSGAPGHGSGGARVPARCGALAVPLGIEMSFVPHNVCQVCLQARRLPCRGCGY